MALDNETKSPVVEPQEKTTTEVPAVEVNEDNENIELVKEPQDEKLTEKIIVPLEETNQLKDVEPVVVTEVSEIKENEAVAEIIAKNVDEIVVVKQEEPVIDPDVTDDEKEENDPIVCENQSVPADEIAMKKDAEMKEKKDEETKVECGKEPIETLKIEEPVTDVNKKQDVLENKENVGTDETENATTDVEKPALEHVKTESKEEKAVDEIKLTDSTPKEDEKPSPKQSISLMGKVKKSFMKAKKAMSGKNNTPTNKNHETKEDDKA